jgi:hypothetical protein
VRDTEPTDDRPVRDQHNGERLTSQESADDDAHGFSEQWPEIDDLEQLRSNIRTGGLRRLFKGRGMNSVEIDTAFAVLGDLATWSSDGLGKHPKVRLTFAEKIKYRVNWVDCVDKPKPEVKKLQQQRWRANARERDRLYHQERRDAFAAAANADARPEALLAAIPTGKAKAISVPELVRAVAHWKCWTTPAGERLDGTSLDRVLRRWLGKLEARGLVESEMRKGKRGKTRFIWQKSHRNRTSGFPRRRDERNPHEMGIKTRTRCPENRVGETPFTEAYVVESPAAAAAHKWPTPRKGVCCEPSGQRPERAVQQAPSKRTTHRQKPWRVLLRKPTTGGAPEAPRGKAVEVCGSAVETESPPRLRRGSRAGAIRRGQRYRHPTERHQ